MPNTPITVSIDVQYTRSEYLAFVEEFLPFGLTAKKNSISPWAVEEPNVSPGRFTRLLVRCVASVAFLYKVSRIGACRFTFSHHGLSRDAKDGTLSLAWSDVRRVFRLKSGYLFAKSNGAMPVPYRVLGMEQHANLERLLVASGHPPRNAV